MKTETPKHTSAALKMSMRLWPKITTPDPTPFDNEFWESVSRDHLEWLSKHGSYGQRLIAGRYLRDWSKDHR